eukprot:13883963-Heterocapsa_arctica.AAC.1
MPPLQIAFKCVMATRDLQESVSSRSAGGACPMWDRTAIPTPALVEPESVGMAGSTASDHPDREAARCTGRACS